MKVAALLAALLVAVGIAKYGLNPWSSWQNFYQIAQNWQDPTVGNLVNPPQDYILSNSLPTVLIGALGLTWQPAYLSLQVCLVLFAIVLPLLMPAVRESVHTSRLAFVLIAGGPTLVLLLTGVGGYDPLCVIGATVAVLARNRWISSFGWLVYSLTHTSLAVLTFACWVAVVGIGRLNDARRDFIIRVTSGAVGVLLGALGVWLFTNSLGGVTSRLEAFRLYDLDYYVNAYIAGMPVILFSALGVGWIILLDRSVLQARSARILVVVCLLVGLIVPLVTLDESRTVALITGPLLLAWVAASKSQHSTLVLHRLWSRYGLAAAIIPVVLVWSGELTGFGFQSLLHWRANF